MTESHEELQDRMRRYGFQEKEAEAAYHLRQARECFYEMSSGFFDSLEFSPHFNALFNVLGRKVLARDYPEGWGRTSEQTSEEDSEEGPEGG